MDERIEALQRKAAARPEVIGLGGGLPSPRQFPRRALAAAFLRALAEPAGSALQYGWAEGTPRLRELVAERLRSRGATAVSADDVIVTSGAQQAIDLAAQVICDGGACRVGVEPATYPAALDLFRARRARPVAFAFGARIASARADFAGLYLMPAVGNPSGRALSGDERAWALATTLPIIEDDAYAELRFAGPPAPPLVAEAPERVFHVGTVSKTLSPGLRIGWLVPPRRHRKRALALKQTSDLQSGSLAQAVLQEFLVDDDRSVRFAKLRAFYRRRAQRLAAAVRRHLPQARFSVPEGGFSLWLAFDDAEGVDEAALLARAVAEGVSFDPGSSFRPDGAASPLALRLCHSFVEEDQFDEGVQRLARALRATQASRREPVRR